jgi:hypothetical protein
MTASTAKRPNNLNKIKGGGGVTHKLAFGAGERRRWAVVLGAANVLAEALIYFSAEKGVGVRILAADASAAPPRRGTFDVVQQFSDIGTPLSNCNKVRG